ncbi:MAG: hypothetical protein AMK69_03520 [Nitrospira bacterium SG8_3]|nr:MAG: hypothetical protein AMK69_03520 [Nitrospira bacterium SG8_3]
MIKRRFRISKKAFGATARQDMTGMAKTYYWMILCFLLVACPAVSRCQDDMKDSNPGLTASVEPAPAQFGTMVVLTLAYRLPEGSQLPAEPQIKGLEGLTAIERQTAPGQIKIRFLIDQLDAWKTGPLSLAYVNEEGKEQVLTSDPVSIPVLSNLGEKPEEARLRPIQGIFLTSALWPKYMRWGAALLGVLLAVSGFVWWRKKGRIQKVSAEVVYPPHVLARKEIELLEAQELFEKGEVKGFYFRFSEILRRYLESLRRFPAAEFTTEEIALRIHSEEDRRLLSLLRHADLVKFADSIPTRARKEEEVKTALSYIQETGSVLDTGQATDGDQGAAT